MGAGPGSATLAYGNLNSPQLKAVRGPLKVSGRRCEYHLTYGVNRVASASLALCGC